MIGAGAILAFVGICFFPAGLGEHDSSVLGLGAAVFGFGALIAAAGFYSNAQAVRALPLPASLSKEALAAKNNPPRGGCDLCKKETPVINCKVHNFHLCGSCLADHYDFRACVYVPSTRRIDFRNTKSMASRAR
jgi:hypothetical protein